MSKINILTIVSLQGFREYRVGHASVNSIESVRKYVDETPVDGYIVKDEDNNILHFITHSCPHTIEYETTHP